MDIKDLSPEMIAEARFEANKHKFGTWADFFLPFIMSDEFTKIVKFLKHEARRGKIICPKSENTFRCFSATDYRELRAVFILQDPYPWIIDGVMVADGLALSCENTKYPQPSLRLFYGGIQSDIQGGQDEAETDTTADIPYSLKYLADQGVLLLNTALTVEKGKVGSHQSIWEPFMKYFIENLNYYHSGLPIVFFGKEAQRYMPLVAPFHHYPFEVSHPAAAAHKDTDWDSKGIFTSINNILERNNGKEFTINWLNSKND